MHRQRAFRTAALIAAVTAGLLAAAIPALPAIARPRPWTASSRTAGTPWRGCMSIPTDRSITVSPGITRGLRIPLTIHG